MAKSNLSDAQWNEIHGRALEGESLYTLRDEFGISKSSIYRMLKRRYNFSATGHRRALWPQTFFPTTNRVTRSYMAGIFDGEGCILYLTRSSRGLYQAKVTMTDRGPIDLFASFGGSFSIERPEGYKVKYRWTVSRQLDVEAFLLSVLPYLRVKHKKAKVALDFIADGHPNSEARPQ